MRPMRSLPCAALVLLGWLSLSGLSALAQAQTVRITQAIDESSDPME